MNIDRDDPNLRRKRLAWVPQSYRSIRVAGSGAIITATANVKGTRGRGPGSSGYVRSDPAQRSESACRLGAGKAENHHLTGHNFCRPKNVRKADSHSDLLRATCGIGNDAAANCAVGIHTP